LSKLATTSATPVATSSRRRGDCYQAACITREILDHVFSRWGGLVLGALLERKKRYSELRDQIGGISEKMLAQTLRALERDGLIERRSYPVVPPHVEYLLTPLGRDCAVRVGDLVDWIESHVRALARAQAEYDGAD
jgi:DNA-binding HxlR family transcriptional regulator